ncbi:hypothetical protein GCM10008959_06740 [Deinococcus seoulensis]|uniref:Uncharacterized protein n=1 Tax=Deinococcus seoulensis TaxID=1837379 RepID=A0ABQ2RPW0_9DEIO|nr:hypothetical protein GCM10008959_06740 [Deinococcus seoulensis]
MRARVAPSAGTTSERGRLPSTNVTLACPALDSTTRATRPAPRSLKNRLLEYGPSGAVVVTCGGAVCVPVVTAPAGALNIRTVRAALAAARGRAVRRGAAACAASAGFMPHATPPAPHPNARPLTIPPRPARLSHPASHLMGGVRARVRSASGFRQLRPVC